MSQTQRDASSSARGDGHSDDCSPTEVDRGAAPLGAAPLGAVPVGVPSAAAIAQLKAAASELDVQDVVDLCYAKASDRLRTAIYLEALRHRSGDQAQLAACLLCFDLARRGDAQREVELAVLLPSLARLFALETTSPMVASLVEKSPVVLLLWQALVQHHEASDHRVVDIAVQDAEVLEVALFDGRELGELQVQLAELALFDDSLSDADTARVAFNSALEPLLPAPGEVVLSARDQGSLQAVTRIAHQAESFAQRVPLAAELHCISTLFLATHTRARGFFGQRNRARDRLLVDGLAAWLTLPAPPAHAAAWLVAGPDGADAHAWDKVAELLLDVCSYLAQHGGATVDVAAPARDLATGYTASARSQNPPRVLQPLPLQTSLGAWVNRRRR